MRTLAVPVAAGATLALVALIGLTYLRPPGHPTQAELAHQIAGELRCPDCQGLSVADSPSGSATEIRTQVDQLLARGLSADQVRSHFVDRYGEWILLSPPRHGWNLLPWAVPIVGLLAGVTVWVALVRRRASRTNGAVTETEHRRIEHQLADLEERG